MYFVSFSRRHHAKYFIARQCRLPERLCDRLLRNSRPGSRHVPYRAAQSARSYIPEVPWNDSCAGKLIYNDPVNGAFTQAYGPSGFCNSPLSLSYFQFAVGGSGGPSTCFTGTPSIPGVVSGTCKGRPRPPFQRGVPGIPRMASAISSISRSSLPTAYEAASMWSVCQTWRRAARHARLRMTQSCWAAAASPRSLRRPWQASKR